MLEETPCPLCGSDERRPWRRSPDRLLRRPRPLWEMVACRACGSRYLNPRPAPEALPEHYPPEYLPYQINPKAERRFRFADPGRLSPRDRSFMAHHLGYAHYLQHGDPQPGRCLPPDYDMALSPPPPWRKGGGKLLEIGCSHGLYLERVRELGWEVEGLELDATAARHARQKRGLIVREGHFQQNLYAPHSFHALALWQVLEHLPDPLGALREFHRILRPDGHLLLAVPNAGGFASALMRNYYAPLDPPRHFTHFTLPSLRAFLETAGFEVQWLINPASTRDLLRSCAFLADQHISHRSGDRIYQLRKKRHLRRFERKLGRLLAHRQWGSRITALARPRQQ